MLPLKMRGFIRGLNMVRVSTYSLVSRDAKEHKHQQNMRSTVLIRFPVKFKSRVKNLHHGAGKKDLQPDYVDKAGVC